MIRRTKGGPFARNPRRRCATDGAHTHTHTRYSHARGRCSVASIWIGGTTEIREDTRGRPDVVFLRVFLLRINGRLITGGRRRLRGETGSASPRRGDIIVLLARSLRRNAHARAANPIEYAEDAFSAIALEDRLRGSVFASSRKREGERMFLFATSAQ